MKPPSRQLYVENHRAHQGMLGCQQNVQGNSGIIIGASIMVGHSSRPLWEMVGHLANMHGKSAVVFSSEYASNALGIIGLAMQGA